jgi:hypothetical protein
MNCPICVQPHPSESFYQCTRCRQSHCNDCHESIRLYRPRCPFCRSGFEDDTPLYAPTGNRPLEIASVIGPIAWSEFIESDTAMHYQHYRMMHPTARQMEIIRVTIPDHAPPSHGIWYFRSSRPSVGAPRIIVNVQINLGVLETSTSDSPDTSSEIQTVYLNTRVELPCRQGGSTRRSVLLDFQVPVPRHHEDSQPPTRFVILCIPFE